jgi:hypothetical protein
VEGPENIANGHVVVVAARTTAHLRKFVGDDPHLGFRSAVASWRFRKIGQSLYVKNRADDWIEKPVEPHGLIDSQGLNEGFIEKRYDRHR